jgi:hypothetical protein
MATVKEFKATARPAGGKGVITARSSSLIVGNSHRLADFAALCPIR